MVNDTSTTISTPASLRPQLSIAFLAFILLGANDGALGVLIPSISLHYHADKATIGSLFLVQTAGYLIAAFNSGPLVEKLGIRRFLLLGIAIFLLGAVTLSLMPPFLVLLGALVPFGFGIALIDAGLNTYITALPHSAARLNYLHAFYGTGALLGPLVASAIITLAWGWNSTYLLWAALGFIVFGGIAATFKRQPSIPQGEAAPTTGNHLLSTLRLPVIWIAAAFLLCYVGIEVSLGAWSYSFLTEFRHGSPLLMGWVVSGYWLGLTLGRITLAWGTRWIGEHRLIQLCIFGVLGGILLIWLVPFQVGAIVGLGFTGFCLGPIFPTTIAITPKLAGSSLMASAVGFIMSMAAGGAAFFPWLAGNLMERVGLWSLMPYVFALAIVLLLLWQALRIRARKAS